MFYEFNMKNIIYYPVAGFFWEILLGGCGGRGGGIGLDCGTAGGCFDCWFKASIILAVFATGGGGAGKRISIKKAKRMQWN